MRGSYVANGLSTPILYRENLPCQIAQIVLLALAHLLRLTLNFHFPDVSIVNDHSQRALQVGRIEWGELDACIA